MILEKDIFYKFKHLLRNDNFLTERKGCYCYKYLLRLPNKGNDWTKNNKIPK